MKTSIISAAALLLAASGLRAEPADLLMTKPATASSVWGIGIEANKACDGDYKTHWGAGKDTRSAWLEMDLGTGTNPKPMNPRSILRSITRYFLLGSAPR